MRLVGGGGVVVEVREERRFVRKRFLNRFERDLGGLVTVGGLGGWVTLRLAEERLRLRKNEVFLERSLERGVEGGLVAGGGSSSSSS